MVEPEPRPTWRELFRQIARNQEAKKALEGWRSRRLVPGDPGFTEDEVVVRATRYLDSWVAKNYGAMAALLSANVASETVAMTAGMIREECAQFELLEYTVHAVEFQAAAVCEVDVELVFESSARHARMRWIREGTDGQVAAPNEAGEWDLYLWGPWAMLNRAEDD